MQIFVYRGFRGIRPIHYEIRLRRFCKTLCHLLRDLFFFPFAHPAISVIINHVTGMEARISLVLKRSLDFSFKDNYEVSGFFLAVAA